jgi:hypothetical protein
VCDTTGYVCKTSCVSNTDCARQNKCMGADAGTGPGVCAP